MNIIYFLISFLVGIASFALIIITLRRRIGTRNLIIYLVAVFLFWGFVIYLIFTVDKKFMNEVNTAIAKIFWGLLCLSYLLFPQIPDKKSYLRYKVTKIILSIAGFCLFCWGMYGVWPFLVIN